MLNIHSDKFKMHSDMKKNRNNNLQVVQETLQKNEIKGKESKIR